MDIKLCNYKNGASCAFSFTLDDGCYYDSSVKMMEIFEDVYNKTGTKIKATTGITVNFMHERVIDFWRLGVEKGYFDIASHTVGHDVCYSSETPYEVRKADAENAQKLLREMFPGQNVNTFFYAGGPRDEEGISVLADHYLACRANMDGINHAGKINWLLIDCFTAMLKRPVSDYTDFIDTVVKEKGWGVQMNHWITTKEEDVFHSQGVACFDEECHYLGKKAQECGIWTGSFEEVGAYLRRYEKSTLNITNQDGKTKVEIITDSSVPKAALDTELTISVQSQENITVYNKDGSTTILAPNKDGNVYINVSDYVIFE